MIRSRAAGFASRLSAALLLGLALFVSSFAVCAAQADVQASELRVKAAFLFKFGSYVEWPPESFATATAPLNIGVVNADALADELASVTSGRSIHGRTVVVRKLRATEEPTDLSIVFVGATNTRELKAMLSKLKGSGALVVTESARALELGSMINFVIVDGRLRFDVALGAVDSGGLKISSRLLAVARRVAKS